jgi:hypothetical protein
MIEMRRLIEVSWLKVRRLVILFIVFISVGMLAIKAVERVAAVPLSQEDMPVYYWRVCEDLGMGSVAGVTGSVQRFNLCHGQGWVLQAYCLQPQVPPPPVDTICERFGDTFWCGDEYQRLREYQVLQTPLPVQTDTPTPTETFTPSPTIAPTDTPLPSDTPTPTLTDTPFPSNTPAPTSTETAMPTIAFTTQPVETATTQARNVQAQTATPRPRAGGKGNAEPADLTRWFAGVILIGLGATVGFVGLKLRSDGRRPIQ